MRMSNEGQQESAWGAGLPGLASSWRSIALWRWLLWTVGVICAGVSFDARGQGAVYDVFAGLAIACFAVSVPPWRWPRGRETRGRSYYDALADYAKQLASLDAARSRGASARAAVRTVPARFEKAAAAVIEPYRTRGSNGLSFAERWERQVRLRRDFERFAADV